MVDFSKIKTYPIKERKNKFTLSEMIPLDNAIKMQDDNLQKVAEAIVKAKNNNRKVVAMIGGAVVKVGCSGLLIDLMKKGYIDHIALNGGASIHDFEIAMIGETSEDVPNSLIDGKFGMAEETGRLMNEAINESESENIGCGLSLARQIEKLDFPYKEFSIIYSAMKLDIPPTVHIAIGNDIIHQHPSCNGAALGKTSFTDFKIYTDTISKLKEGVVLNIGSAVILPEVFLKALTIARNLGYDVRNFTTANFDFLSLYRPKTRIIDWPKLLGCKGYDIRENHNKTIPTLHKLILFQAE